jgi:AcrR family transcriptional regulator
MPRLKAPQRREQLIQVATRLFAEHGYEATTTKDIAKSAGVTEPILYRHFKSKQELFVAIVRNVSDQTIKHWQEIISGSTDPAERIRLVAAAMPDHMKRLEDQYHVLHGALATSRDKKVLGVVKEHYKQIEQFFRTLVTDGQKAAVFRKELDPRAAAYQLIFSGIGYAMINLNLGGMERSMIQDVIDAILRGMKCA